MGKSLESQLRRISSNIPYILRRKAVNKRERYLTIRPKRVARHLYDSDLTHEMNQLKAAVQEVYDTSYCGSKRGRPWHCQCTSLCLICQYVGPFESRSGLGWAEITWYDPKYLRSYLDMYQRLVISPNQIRSNLKSSRDFYKDLKSTVMTIARSQLVHRKETKIFLKMELLSFQLDVWRTYLSFNNTIGDRVDEDNLHDIDDLFSSYDSDEYDSFDGDHDLSPPRM